MSRDKRQAFLAELTELTHRYGYVIAPDEYGHGPTVFPIRKAEVEGKASYLLYDDSEDDAEEWDFQFSISNEKENTR